MPVELGRGQSDVRWLHGVISNGTRFVQPILRTPFALLQIGLTHYFLSKSVGGEDGIVRHYLSDSVASADKSRSALTPSPKASAGTSR
jgi:hypothetical protein